MAGHAVTLRFAAEQPAGRPGSRYESWKYILETPEPRVLVLQDLDQPPGAGAYLGEVMATIHRRLGCIGAVTNGFVRDLDEVHPLGFHFFAAGVCVSHAYVHLVDFGTPVEVGGMRIRTGDLLHADKHGVLVVPKEIADKIPEAAAQVAEFFARGIEAAVRILTWAGCRMKRSAIRIAESGSWKNSTLVRQGDSRLLTSSLSLCCRGRHGATVRADEKPRWRRKAPGVAGLRQQPARASKPPGNPGHRPLTARHRIRRYSRGEAASANARARHHCLCGGLGTVA